MKAYHIRIEQPNGTYYDRAVNAATQELAKTKFMNASVHHLFDWRGLVVFVDGAYPAEEAPMRRKRAA